MGLVIVSGQLLYKTHFSNRMVAINQSNSLMTNALVDGDGYPRRELNCW